MEAMMRKVAEADAKREAAEAAAAAAQAAAEALREENANLRFEMSNFKTEDQFEMHARQHAEEALDRAKARIGGLEAEKRAATERVVGLQVTAASRDGGAHPGHAVAALCWELRYGGFCRLHGMRSRYCISSEWRFMTLHACLLPGIAQAEYCNKQPVLLSFLHCRLQERCMELQQLLEAARDKSAVEHRDLEARLDKVRLDTLRSQCRTVCLIMAGMSRHGHVHSNPTKQHKRSPTSLLLVTALAQGSLSSPCAVCCRRPSPSPPRCPPPWRPRTVSCRACRQAATGCRRSCWKAGSAASRSRPR